MMCDICNRRAGILFIKLSQPQGTKTHTAKAHACHTCHGILVEMSARDNSTVTEISQQEYNELPEVSHE